MVEDGIHSRRLSMVRYGEGVEFGNGAAGAKVPPSGILPLAAQDT